MGSAAGGINIGKQFKKGSETWRRTRVGEDAADSASWMSFSDALSSVVAHMSLKSLKASRLSLKRCNVLINATTSERWSRLAFDVGLSLVCQINYFLCKKLIRTPRPSRPSRKESSRQYPTQ